MYDDDCIEEDGRTFTIDQDVEPLPSPSRKNAGLGLNFAKVECGYAEAEGIQEQDVLVRNISAFFSRVIYHS